MIISFEFSAYNWRRYGRPWIAKVTQWPIGGKAVLQWGHYQGDEKGGDIEIEAFVGDVIRWGQKDERHPHKSINHWGIIQEDGSTKDVSEAEAAKHFRYTLPAMKELAAGGSNA